MLTEPLTRLFHIRTWVCADEESYATDYAVAARTPEQAINLVWHDRTAIGSALVIEDLEIENKASKMHLMEGQWGFL